MSMPAFDSVIPKSEAMSDRSPMGMNSEVLKMNVENVSPITGSQARTPDGVFSVVMAKIMYFQRPVKYFQNRCFKKRAQI